MASEFFDGRRKIIKNNQNKIKKIKQNLEKAFLNTIKHIFNQ